MTLAKLKIKKIVSKTSATLTPTSNEADIFTVQFNPEQFEVVKGNKYISSAAGMGSDTSKLQFKGGAPQSLTINMKFDSTATGQPVHNLYMKLRKFTMVDTSALEQTTQLGEPPWVMVQWGSYMGFVAAIKEMKETYTFFKPDGTPLRATVALTLEQVTKPTSSAAQNPTSRSEPRRTWMVEDGQRLDWIAFQEYGDSSAWRHIAEENGIDNPFELQSGQVLRLTPRNR
jgi:phage protein U